MRDLYTHTAEDAADFERFNGESADLDGPTQVDLLEDFYLDAAMSDADLSEFCGPVDNDGTDIPF